ncbi:MAG: hypothetical protein ACYC7D_15950 [Nitrososphaerales archaeon]
MGSSILGKVGRLLVGSAFASALLLWVVGLPQIYGYNPDNVNAHTYSPFNPYLSFS